MNSATQSTRQSTPQHALSVLEGRFASLRFPPYFHAVMATSALGSLGELWNRLSESDRSDLSAFEKGLRRGHRLELLGNTGEAAHCYRTLALEHPRFRVIAEEMLSAMGESIGPDAGLGGHV